MRRPLCVLCLLMMLGIILFKSWGLSWEGKAPNSIFFHAQVFVSGIVERQSSSENAMTLYLKKVQVRVGEEVFFPGKIKVVVNSKEEIAIGDGVKLSGQMSKIEEPRNPGEFDQKSYEACRQVIYQVQKGKIQEILRQKKYEGYLKKVRERIFAVFTENAGTQAGIFGAMILGDKSSLEQETKSLYQMAGIVHILAISGLHLSMIGMGIFESLRRLGLRNGSAGFFSLVIIYQYGIFTGGSAATWRAVIMLLIGIGAKVLGRTYDLPTALSIGAVLLLLECPENLYSSGFLLSFGAVLGIGIVDPILEEKLEIKNPIGKLLLASASVQVISLPIQLWFYYETSICGLFLNLFVLPTVAAVLLSGILGGLLGLFWSGGARIVLLPGRALLLIYEQLCEWGIWLPFGVWTPGRPSLLQIFVYYAILFGIVSVFQRQKEKKLLWGSGMLVCVSIGILGYRAPSFSITCLDIGQGDGIVLSTEAGRVFLCDGGSSSKSKIGQYQILPYLKYKGYSQVDGIFVTHTDDDHISGIREVLELQAEKRSTVKIKNLYLPSWIEEPLSYEELCALAMRAGVSVQKLKKGQSFSDGTVQIRVLHPIENTKIEDINEAGLVLEVTRGNFRALLTGDIGIETEENLLEELKACTFLKVGHHGSKNSTGMEFLKKIQPKIAFISCSESNRYGHPAKETLERLAASGTKTYITKDCGALTLTVTKRGMKVSQYLKTS